MSWFGNFAFLYKQLHIDKCSPYGEKYCVSACLLLLRHLGSCTPSSEDLFPFLKGGCCYAMCIPWPKIVPTWWWWWWWWWWWLLLYSAIIRSRADSLRSHVILHEWLAFYSAFINIHRSGVLTALAWLVPHETAAVSAHVLSTPYNHVPCHVMQSRIRKVCACLAVACHMHF